MERTGAHRPLLAAALAAFTSIVGWTAPASARAITDPLPGDPDSACLASVKALSFAASSSTINSGDFTTLSWNVQIPAGCGAKVDLGGPAVAPQGSIRVQPLLTSAYALHASLSGKTRTLGTVIVTAQGPLPQTVTIRTNDVRLFLAAVTSPGHTVIIDSQVVLDLSTLADIRIPEGVTVWGARTPRDPGPLLFTTTKPEMLLEVAGNHVRIHGLRIQGAEMDIAEDEFAAGIFIDSLTSVEIDGNEISGWSGSGVKVEDTYDNIQPWNNPDAVHVHDNFIHHNQHDGTQGYGVMVGVGAYALIERNVFDYNRHAIAGDGSDWSGYSAFENLVLEHGGCHHDIDGVCVDHTHQFDMHGQDSCFPTWEFNCGTAGYSMEILRNTFFYTEEVDIKLRGIPQQSMIVGDNVFLAETQADAMEQTQDRGLVAYDNLYGVDGAAELGTCDLDGDGVGDTFMATGQTWWYSSRGQGPWTYLNTSTVRYAAITLRDFDGDGRCDVGAGGVFSSGGTGPWTQPRSITVTLGGSLSLGL